MHDVLTVLAYALLLFILRSCPILLTQERIHILLLLRAIFDSEPAKRIGYRELLRGRRGMYTPALVLYKP